MKRKIMILIILLMVAISGCASVSQNEGIDNRVFEKFEVAANDNINFLEGIKEPDKGEEDKKERVPVSAQWQTGDIDFDYQDTVYYKEFYDESGEGKFMDIRYPEVNLQEDMEEYFDVDDKIVEGMYILVDMFYDNRTIEMEEEELKELFYAHGYYLYLHHGEIGQLHIRLIEIQEINGLTIYPSRTLIQTWNEEYIYLADITGPTPRKIRSFLTIDDKEKPQMIIHSSGFSADYVSEEELSFWEFHDTYWVLVPLELEIDTSHAYYIEHLYGDLDRDKLFPVVYYRDGIVYRSSTQYDGSKWGRKTTFRLGKMEEVEKNKSFRLIGIYENFGRTFEEDSCYIQYTIL